MVYITGDTHREFERVEIHCLLYETVKTDTLIILGDAGINYLLDARDVVVKEYLATLPITLFCVHGNHEERAENIKTYRKKKYFGGTVYYEKEYPNILFAKSGEIYTICGKQCLVIGGAYSVDKEYRLEHGLKWFESEQLTEDEKQAVETKLNIVDWTVDYVFSHTCPIHVRPTHLFLKGINQSKVDTSMEEWLQSIADKLKFTKWYFGHYHDNWCYDKYKMLFTDIIMFPERR